MKWPKDSVCTNRHSLAMCRGVMVVCLFYYLQGIIQAFPGYTTAGHSFMAAFPQHCLHGEPLFTLYITTMTARAHVNIMHPVSLLSVYTKNKRIVIERFKQVPFVASAVLAMRENRIYNTIQIESDSPVRILAKAACTVGVSMDVMALVPVEYFKRVYIVTTGKGFPFMIVFSTYISNIPTNVRIRFSSIGVESGIKCDLYSQCKSNSSHGLILPSGKCWFFKIDDPKSDLHDTRVSSDTPIHVISGNLMLNFESSKIRDTFVMSSSTSPTSWGKYYFVPNFDKSEYLNLRFLTSQRELKCTVYRYNTTRIVIKVRAKYSFSKQGYDLIHADKNHITIESNHPFCVTLFGKVNPSLFMGSLIPRELWTNYGVYVKMSSRLIETVLLVTDTIQDLFADELGSSEKFYIGEKNKEMMFTELPVFSVTFAYVASHKGRVLLYNKIISESEVSGCPVTYYTSDINYEHQECHKTHPMSDDGRDNDCDGMIDEEIKDNLDNDGDKLVDEDYKQRFQHGGWAGWTSACKTKCDDLVVEKHYRICNNPAPSLTGKQCVGKDEKCSTSAGSELVCPDKCGQKEFTSVCKPECPASCVCEKNGWCESCKRDYFTTKYCGVPCPEGWSGVGCNQLNQTILMAREEILIQYWMVVLLSLSPVFILTLLALAMCLFNRSKWRNRYTKEPHKSALEENL